MHFAHTPRHISALQWLIPGFALLLSCAVELDLYRPAFLIGAENGLRDWYIQNSASDQDEDRITVIDIDEKSLIEIGSWPWRRTQLADLVEILLSHYQARLVALDMVLPESADRPGDLRLAALAGNGPLVLAQALDLSWRPDSLNTGFLSGAVSPIEDQTELPEASGYIANHAGLATARCTGNIGIALDQDGQIRNLPLLTRYHSQVFPALPLALLICDYPPDKRREFIDNLPLEGTPELWRIPFSRSLEAYTVIPAKQIFNLSAPEHLLSGRIILVGSSSMGLSDRVSTPLGTSVGGVMVHAEALSSLLDWEEHGIPQTLPLSLASLFWALLTIAISWLTLKHTSALWSLLSMIVLLFCWLIIGSRLHLLAGNFFMLTPFVGWFAVTILQMPLEWWISQRESRRIYRTFSSYVAKPVLDELMRTDAKQALAPRYREVTVLIADMENYTGMTEQLSLPDAALLTTDFLDRLTQPVLARNGTLDKYTGDGLVAFWGAPLPIENHAQWALDAALDIVREVAIFNRERQLHGLPNTRVRIGIESGLAIVGDLGTPFRSTYTAVGDCINVASRLQEHAKTVDHDILIGGETAKLIQDPNLILLDAITLRGRQQTKYIYAIA